MWHSWVRSFQGQTSLSWSTLERIHWLHGCLTWEVTRVTSCSVPQNMKLEVPTPLQIQSFRPRCYFFLQACMDKNLPFSLSDLSLSILGKLAKCGAYKMACESLAHQETMLLSIIPMGACAARSLVGVSLNKLWLVFVGTQHHWSNMDPPKTYTEVH